ncbi:hypothetical protein DFR26_2218 [Paraperlucidibaca baekdonensis]|uniref:Uncharacterized protein n=1 Tax=Paraperlucidibaca baekdonensis TaxID=748120 RepID=A0A3E0GZX3_9GAMM|nr:hypothetical protein [Paraperlucidibaca baekdonensis]REH35612.1 hypothetical protein DFR26_2218 [Paraperlucidibaca baekdonensis]
MHPFNCFDFTQAPDLTVLDDLLQNQLGLVDSAKYSDGCFIPLPAQTGIGKTHTACALMLERMLLNIKNSLSKSDEIVPELTYYITNSTDNVRNGLNGLQALIEQQQIDGKPRFNNEQQAFLKSQIVHLHAQDNQLLSLANEDREHLLSAFRHGDVGRIRDALRELDSFEKSATTNRVVAKHMVYFARTTYKQLRDHIRLTMANHKIVLSEDQQEAVFKLLPGEKVVEGKACVLFMTTKKFMHGYDSLKSRINPIEHLSKSLLIIDEIDRQNSEILDVLCDSQAIDLVKFGKSISANLSHHVLEKSTRYNGVDELLEPLIQRTQDYAQTWHMKYHFMIEGSSLDERPVRLFSDRSITHAHSTMHHLSIHTDHERQKNIIVSTDKAMLDIEGPNEMLSRFINESDWLFREFTRTFQWSAQRIIKNETLDFVGRIDHLNQYLGAVTSLLTHYGLEVYRPIVLDVFNARFRSLDHHRSRLAKRSYHDIGLKFTEVARTPDARDTMSCHYKSLSTTPTGLLAQMVDSGANILGISATASSPTVIHNFDHQYLSLRLGTRYRSLSDDQRKQLGAYYTSRRRYEEAGIRIHCQYIRAQTDNVNAVLTQHENHPPRDLAWALAALVKTSGDSYGVEWFSKLLAAMEVFVLQPYCRYMVALLNRTLVAEPPFIATLEAYLNERSNRPVKFFAGINAEAMRDGRYDDAQKHLSTTLDKVILISTYPSMGEGKNPDYRVQLNDDESSLRWVGDGAKSGQCRGDIDAIYLEKPTNMLLTHSDTKTNLVITLHQLLCLQSAGFISHTKTKTWITRILCGARSEENTTNYNLTDDSPYATRRIIQQAIGRMARTAYKRPEILVMCDSELTHMLGGDDSLRDTLSHEYAALRDYCKRGCAEFCVTGISVTAVAVFPRS